MPARAGGRGELDVLSDVALGEVCLRQDGETLAQVVGRAQLDEPVRTVLREIDAAACGEAAGVVKASSSAASR